MPRSLSHREAHLVHRIGWLRAAVLGANDGLVSTASLIVGVAAASSGKPEIVVAGLAGLAAGAMSMAAGEYVSVSSQSDTEDADLERERRELADDPAAELTELAEIYKGRGVDPDLAQKVAEQLTASDALKAHARDELGITEAGAAPKVADLSDQHRAFRRPVQHDVLTFASCSWPAFCTSTLIVSPSRSTK